MALQHDGTTPDTPFINIRKLAALDLVLHRPKFILALNYLPLLLYAIDLVRHKTAQREVAVELADKDKFVRKYTLQSLLLVLPLIVPILALGQEMRRRRV